MKSEAVRQSVLFNKCRPREHAGRFSDRDKLAWQLRAF